MRIGVQNFSPDRLAEALKFGLVTKSKLAEEIGKTPSLITNYLSGNRAPSPETFEKMCEVLKQPRKFFLSPPLTNEADPALMNWRSLSKKRLADRLRGESLLRWVIETHLVFENIFDLPRFDLASQFDQFDLPEDFRKINTDHIESAAEKLREIWGLGDLPIRNLLRTAEKAGIVVGTFNLNVQQLDAVSTYYKGTPYVLLNTFKQSGSRGRFDLAHEIGHLILHRGVTENDLKGNCGKAIYDRMEDEAHRFAGALLLPKGRFTNDFWAPTFKCFEDMKAKWKVAIQAMMHRASDLKLITKEQYNWLYIAVSKRKMRIVEPLDEVILREKIRLFPKCFERYEEDYGKSGVIDLVERLPFADETLEELCGLEDAYFSNLRNNPEVDPDSDNLVRFEFRNKKV